MNKFDIINQDILDLANYISFKDGNNLSDEFVTNSLLSDITQNIYKDIEYILEPDDEVYNEDTIHMFSDNFKLLSDDFMSYMNAKDPENQYTSEEIDDMYNMYVDFETNRAELHRLLFDSEIEAENNNIVYSKSIDKNEIKRENNVDVCYIAHDILNGDTSRLTAIAGCGATRVNRNSGSIFINNIINGFTSHPDFNLGTGPIFQAEHLAIKYRKDKKALEKQINKDIRKAIKKTKKVQLSYDSAISKLKNDVFIHCNRGDEYCEVCHTLADLAWDIVQFIKTWYKLPPHIVGCDADESFRKIVYDGGFLYHIEYSYSDIQTEIRELVRMFGERVNWMSEHQRIHNDHKVDEIKVIVLEAEDASDASPLLEETGTPPLEVTMPTHPVYEIVGNYYYKEKNSNDRYEPGKTYTFNTSATLYLQIDN